jgi:hypothetical protein
MAGCQQPDSTPDHRRLCRRGWLRSRNPLRLEAPRCPHALSACVVAPYARSDGHEHVFCGVFARDTPIRHPFDGCLFPCPSCLSLTVCLSSFARSFSSASQQQFQGTSLSEISTLKHPAA